jgi:hypothetical protein
MDTGNSERKEELEIYLMLDVEIRAGKILYVQYWVSLPLIL